MEVILQSSVDKLGKAGEVVKVADGFGRNYLIPKGLALPATQRHLGKLNHDRRVAGARARKLLIEAEGLASRVAETTVRITAKVGEQGKLFGAVTTKDIQEALKRKGIVVDRRSIALAEPIKNAGDAVVDIRIHPDLPPAKLNLSVVES